MNFFPDPATILTVGGVSIRWYAVTLILGCILGYLYASRCMRQNGYRQVTSDDLLVVLLVSAVLGGRLTWVLENFKEYSMYAWYVFAIGDGGFEVIGATLGMMLGTRWYTKRHRMSFRRTMDIVFMSMLIVTIVGRCGRALADRGTWIAVALNTIEFIILLYGVVPYRKGRQRGDVTAIGLMLLGISRLVAIVLKFDPLAENSLWMCVIAEVIGIAMYAFNRSVQNTKPVVLFDFDGTLMDSEHMVIGCFAYLFQKYGKLEDFTPEVQKEVFGPPLKEELKKLFPDHNPDILMKEYRAFQKSLPGKHLVQMMPHTLETLQELKQKGYLIGVVTSRLSESCEMWLEDLEIEEYFDIVLGTERFRHAKPAPDGIVRACEMLNTGHDSVVYIGDNVSDVRSGRNAGVYTIGFVTDWAKREKIENSKPNKTIFDIAEVLTTLEEDHAWSYRSV